MLKNKYELQVYLKIPIIKLSEAVRKTLNHIF